MTKRKPMSKKLRFEVFKRDGFKCQYCGKCAPEVILHVDHISPVSKGGDDELINLITACEPCNLGKSDRELSDDSSIQKQRAMLDELNARREQLEMMLEWREGMKGIDGMAYQAAEDEWLSQVPGWSINETGEKTLKKILSKFGLQKVMDAIETASTQYIKYDSQGSIIPDTVHQAWSKIGGICRMSSQPEWKKELFYVRGILRNRLSYINFNNCMPILEEAYEAGIDIEELKEMARTVKTWTTFVNEIEYLVKG